MDNRAGNSECEPTKIRRVKLIADLITGFPLIKPDKRFQPWRGTGIH